MKQTEFFFSFAVNLDNHQFPKYAEEAMYAVYEACASIKHLKKYGASVETIIVGVILQDNDSRFLKSSIRYYKTKKTINGALKVDISQVSGHDFLHTVQIYHKVILEVLDKVKDRIKDFDFEQLKQDLQEAILEETKVLE